MNSIPEVVNHPWRKPYEGPWREAHECGLDWILSYTWPLETDIDAASPDDTDAPSPEGLPVDVAMAFSKQRRCPPGQVF